MRLAPGDRLGRYEVEALLGEGGMGAVYRAYDRTLQRRVALKILHRPRLEGRGGGEGGEEVDPRAAARMLREARAVAALDHPNTVAIFDVGEADGVSYIAMELVEGTSLRAAMRSTAPLSERLRWLADVARALSAAHDRGVVHRDIKPENVMLRRDGVVKVLDFGISKRLATPLGSPTTSGTGTATGDGMVGTPSYMAPEQLCGGEVDARADQFAWGVLAYEVLSGRRPWDLGPGDPHLVVQILSKTPESLVRVHPEIPAALDQIVQRALSKHRDDRFATMAEVTAAIERIVPRAIEAGAGADPRSGAEHAASFAHEGGRDAREIALRATALATAAGTLATVARRDVGSDAKMARMDALASDAPTPGTLGTRPLAPEPEFPPERVGLPIEGPSSRPSPPAKGELGIQSLAHPAPRRPMGRLTVAVSVLALAVGTAGVGLGQRLHAGRASPPFPSSGSPSPSAHVARSSPASTSPLPVTTTPGAAAAYAGALQSLRDASIMSAIGGLRRAVELDAALAAAHLRLAVLDVVNGASAIREHFRDATRLRAALDERDALLLHAIEPDIVREPADPQECDRRMRAAIERFPRDAELLVFGAMYRLAHGDGEVEELLDRALVLDPQLAIAWWMKGDARRVAGDVDGVARFAARCLSVSPLAVSCLRLRAMAEATSGECDRMADDARRMIALEPEGSRGYEYLATALAGRGAPNATLRAALTQAWTRYPEALRHEREQIDSIELDLLAGDFASADVRARDVEATLTASSTALKHEEVAWWRMQALLESGAIERAARYAGDFLARREAWTVKRVRTNSDLAPEVTPLMLATELRAKAITPDEYVSRHAEWLRGLRAAVPARYLGEVWSDGFAVPATSRQDAERALAALTDLAPPRRFRQRWITDAPLAKVYFLAGKVDDALPLLRRASASCYALEDPVEHTRAKFFLASALEAKGDTIGACSAYHMVLERWGSAKPRSITAGFAAERSRALACPK